MNDRQKSETNMFIRTDQFGVENPLVPPSATATALYAQIRASKDTVLATGGKQTQSTGEFRAAASERRFLVKELRAKLREIAETAKALSRTGVHPGLELQFRMPGPGFQDLRDRAQAFKDALEPIKQDFIDYDSAATVVEDLEAAIADFDEVTGRRFTGLGKRVGATAGIKAAIRAGITAVRALDAILIKRYRDNPGLLAEWKAAQRIAAWPSQSTAPTTPGGGGTGEVPASGT